MEGPHLLLAAAVLARAPAEGRLHSSYLQGMHMHFIKDAIVMLAKRLYRQGCSTGQ